MVKPRDGVVYPREVDLPPGFPKGWKAVEKQYGKGSKTAGQVITAQCRALNPSTRTLAASNQFSNSMELCTRIMGRLLTMPGKQNGVQWMSFTTSRQMLPWMLSSFSLAHSRA